MGGVYRRMRILSLNHRIHSRKYVRASLVSFSKRVRVCEMLIIGLSGQHPEPAPPLVPTSESRNAIKPYWLTFGHADRLNSGRSKVRQVKLDRYFERQ